MKYLGYIWTVISNLIALFVAFAIFGSTYSSFETIVFSLLILIYINLISFSGIYGQTKVKEVLMMHEEFKKMRKLLKEDVSEDDEIFEQEDLKNAKEKAKQNEIKFYINVGFMFIIYIIVLWNLLGAL